MSHLFHLTTGEAWRAAQSSGVYRASSLATQGFIHLSTRHQWLRTANRYFRGQTGVVLLELAPSLLHAEVRFEAPAPPAARPALPAPADELFPHLYGELPCAAVVRVRELTARADGTFTDE
jgi:uncharacterized protein (DUF952 family)